MIDPRSHPARLARARPAVLATLLAVALTTLSGLSSAPAAPRQSLTVARYFASRGAAPGNLADPAGVAADAAGNVYVADAGNGRVDKFSPGGTFRGSWGSPGSGPGQLSQPAGVAVDAQGDVYVADSGNHRIVEFAPNGQLLRSWGSLGLAPGQFNFPTALAIEPGGDLYVADTGNDRVQRFRPTGGEPTLVIGRSGRRRGELESPGGVAVQPNGKVVVADTGNDRVQVFAPTARFVRGWGKPGSRPGRFHDPQGVAVDPQGNVFVADGGNDRLQVFTGAGRYLRESRGRRRGSALAGPAGVATDCGGHVHVVDGDHDRVATLRSRNLSPPTRNRLNFFHSYVAANAAIASVRTDKRLVALTFDDGPSAVFTPQVLDVLAARGVQSTFFLVGRYVSQYPDLVRREIGAGHELANHTYDHPRLTQLPVEQETAELQSGRQAIEQLGVRPRWFRPPFGLFSGEISRIADGIGETTIGWHGTLDQFILHDPAGGVAQMLREVRPGAIILAHDGQRNLEHAVELLPGLLDGLNRLCLRPTTVGRLLHATGFDGVRTGGQAPGVAPSPVDE
jgi:peptidoglycan/xylan/chitin deacetylase (PgdA/CDA1 family)/streptogramin lyase